MTFRKVRISKPGAVIEAHQLIEMRPYQIDSTPTGVPPMTRERMEELATKHAAKQNYNLSFEEMADLLRLARLAPLLAAELQLTRAMLNSFDARDFKRDVRFAKRDTDTALTAAGLTLEQIAKEGT